ncbi:MAG: hypothetical protein Kow0068_11830 [Marinilabiliales bacterium]
MRVIINTVFCIIIFGVVNAQSQQPVLSFGNIATENVKVVRGLSQNTVLSIIQDRYGYLWIGTWDGLNKYNGYDFEIYTACDNGLSSSTINCLLEDKNGNIWAGTDDGVNVFNPVNKQFTVYKYDPINSNSISNDTINCFYED